MSLLARKSQKSELHEDDIEVFTLGTALSGGRYTAIHSTLSDLPNDLFDLFVNSRNSVCLPT